MSNVMIAYPNRATGLSYSQGAWSTSLPITNVSTRRLSQVARSVNAALASTWFYAIASSAIVADVFALCGHNLSTAAKWRVRGMSGNVVPAFLASFRSGTLPSGWTISRTTGAGYTNGTYFDASGVLQTAASGTDARPYYSGGVVKGVLVEPNRTNYFLNSRDLTAVGYWAVTNMNRTKTATGIDGVANAATRLTATAANATVHQYMASPPLYACMSFYIRRVSGTGEIRLSTNSFGSTTVVTVGSSWTRVWLYAGSPTAGNFGIQLQTSGDIIEVDCAQLEQGSYDPTTPIHTTTATVTRAADTLTPPSLAALSLAAGTLAVEAWHLSTPYTGSNFVTCGNGSGGVYARVNNSRTTNLQLTTGSLQADITPSPTLTLDAVFRFAAVWATNDVRCYANQTAGTPDTSAAMPSGAPTSLNIAGQNHSFAISELRIYGTALPNADLNALTGTDLEVSAGYDSGWVDAWPAAYVAATTAEQRRGVPGHSMIKALSAQTYQSWRIDIDDTTNAAGYIEVGRLFAGSAWQPVVNANYGLQLGMLDRSNVFEADSGAEDFVERPSPRFTKFALQWLSEAEGMNTVMDLLTQCGTTGEVFFAYDPSDTTYLPRRSWLGRLRTLSPLEFPLYGLTSTAFEIKELL